MAYTNIALTKFISQEKNDALPNSQGINTLGVGPIVTDTSGVLSAVTPSTSGYVLTSTGPSTQPTFQAAAGGGAPTGALYWVGSSTGATGLTAEIDLGSTLTSGLVKVSVAGSPLLATPSTATPGTDYYAPGFPTEIFDTGGTDQTLAIGEAFTSGSLTSISGSVFIGSDQNISALGDDSVHIGTYVLESGTNGGSKNVIIGSKAANSSTITFGGVTLIGAQVAVGSTIDDSVAIGNRCLENSATAGSVTYSTIVGPLAGTGIQGDITTSVIIGGGAIGSIPAAFSLVDCVLLGSFAGPTGTPGTITNGIAIGADAKVESSNSCVIGASGGDMKVSIGTSASTHTLLLANGTTVGASLSIQGTTSVPAAGAGDSVFWCNASGQPEVLSSLTNSSGIIPTVNGSLSAGDLVYGVSTSTMRLARLGIGTTGQALLVSGGGLPTWGDVADASATYITNTPSSGLPNEFALSTMTTGIVKVTNTTGALTTAAAGTDYQAPYAALTSAGTAGSTAGSIWYGSGTNTVASLAAGTSGQLLSSGGTGAPSWVAPPAALPTITSAGQAVKLSSWNGAAAWACRSPLIGRAPSSNNQSNFPDTSDTNKYFNKYITDEEFCPLTIRNTSGGDDFAGVELGITGFDATVTGQKYFYSVYFRTGWNTDTPASGGMPIFGFMNPTTVAGQNLSGSNYLNPNSGPKLGWFLFGINVNSTTLNYRDNGGSHNIAWNWAGSMNFNGKIISVGYDTTTPEITFWQHDAATGALLGSATRAPSASIQSQTNLVPWLCPFANNIAAISNDTRMQVMSVGYPTISGWTYFYAR
jgi:hypothetical protein